MFKLVKNLQPRAPVVRLVSFPFWNSLTKRNGFFLRGRLPFCLRKMNPYDCYSHHFYYRIGWMRKTGDWPNYNQNTTQSRKHRHTAEASLAVIIHERGDILILLFPNVLYCFIKFCISLQFSFCLNSGLNAYLICVYLPVYVYIWTIFAKQWFVDDLFLPAN